MATEGERIEVLSNFLRESFQLHDLERFLVTKGYGEVADAVDRAVGMDQYSFDVVRELRRRGLIKAGFFNHLKNERPALEGQVKGIQAAWSDQDQGRSKASLSEEWVSEAKRLPEPPRSKDVEHSEETFAADLLEPGAGIAPGEQQIHSPRLKDLEDEIRAILRPLMGDRDSRRARLARIFKRYPGLLDRIGVDGETGVFLDLLIDTLEAFGHVEAGRPAICVLLESVKGEVGAKDRERIERIVRDYPL
jgi:hypothetical protein